MTRHAYGIALLLFLTIPLGVPFAFSEQGKAAASESGIVLPEGALLGSAEQATSEPGNAKIRVRPGTSGRDKKTSIVLRYPEESSAEKAIRFDCEISSEKEVGDVIVRFSVRGISGAKPSSAKLPLLVREGATVCRFTWSGASALDGRYVARCEIVRPQEEVVSWTELNLRKVSLNAVVENLNSAAEAVHEARKYLDSVEDLSSKSPCAYVRIAIAEDSLPVAQEALGTGDWWQAQDIAEYVQQTAGSVRGRLAFSDMAPGLSAGVPQPDLRHVEVRDGAFYAEGKPVFLFGLAGSHMQPPDLSRIRRYGLNLATFAVGPRDSLATTTRTSNPLQSLDSVFAQAEQENVSLMCSLLPRDMQEWVLPDHVAETKYQEDAEGLNGRTDVTKPVVKETIDRHLKAVVPYLAGKSMLNSVSLMERPYFVFSGEQIRKGFQNYVETVYGDRYSMNRAWKASLASFDDVEIGWDKGRSAYRYDWQTYHCRLATDFVSWMAASVRQYAPGLPIQMEARDDFFEPLAIRGSADYETLAALLDIGGCTGHSRPADRYYALGYPGECLTYTLLRSLASDKPIFDSVDNILSCGDLAADNTFSYVYTAMWEAVMAGLNASALSFGVDAPWCILARPDCLEAYAVAGMDINRLGEIVTAFQQAPAAVGILWSTPSVAYEGGAEHLDSLKRAFEGCSFAGWKVRFITDEQCVEGELNDITVLVIPDAPAIADDAFEILDRFSKDDNLVIRGTMPMLRDAWGYSRRNTLSRTNYSFLIGDDDTPTTYLHAMDAVNATGLLPPVPRPINEYGYPLEGVKTLYAEVSGNPYLYIVNLRKDKVACHLAGVFQSGENLISGEKVSFPMSLQPLSPMLIRLEPIPTTEVSVTPKAPSGPKKPHRAIRP